MDDNWTFRPCHGELDGLVAAIEKLATPGRHHQTLCHVIAAIELRGDRYGRRIAERAAPEEPTTNARTAFFKMKF